MIRLLTVVCFIALIFTSYPLSARLNTVEQELVSYDCINGNSQACDAVLLSSFYPGYLLDAENRKQGLRARMASKQLECDQGNIKSCTNLGVLLFHLNSDDSAKSYELFTNSCDSGDGWACSLLGEVSPFVQTSDVNNYRPYYEELKELCANDDYKACATQARLSVLLFDAVPDQSIWYELLVASCEQDVGRACANLSYILSDDGKQENRKLDYAGSILRTQTKRASFTYAKKACELENPVGCWNTALRYSDGSGVKPNFKLAQEYFVKACIKGLYQACDEINYEIYWQTTDAITDLNKACSVGDFSACLIIEQRRFAALTQAQQKETQAEYLVRLKVICENGSLFACANVAVRSHRAGDSVEAERFATVACNQEIGEGCLVLGNVWKFDKNGEGHHARAIDYLAKGCELGSRGACNNLGDSYRKGLGVELNLIRAKRYFTIACEQKLKLACSNLSAIAQES